uniref:Uncharacterized protein n=1 Tax=Rhizophora mucronata TaxID=61149 RepID=A0A2P2PF11_RHIMU
MCKQQHLTNILILSSASPRTCFMHLVHLKLYSSFELR